MRHIVVILFFSSLFSGLTLKAQFTGGSGSGYASSQPTTSLLPVTLASFQANCWGKGHSEIKWSTSLEFNSSHFEVYRSYDGDIFEWVGKEHAAGMSNELKSYQIVDPFVFANNESIVYYALFQYDKEGVFMRFPKIATLINTCGLIAKRNLFYVSTEGIANGFYLKLLDHSGTYTYELRDAIGKTIQKGKVQNEMFLNNIVSGVYFLSLDFMGEKHTQKVLVY